MRDALTEALNRPWETRFEDDCTHDWQEKWFLDGEKATITHSSDGMTYAAGPDLDDKSASHAVLWTKDSFTGNVKMDFDYTRIDDMVGNVNILYLLATGIDEGKKDILRWADERKVPGMGIYLRQMNMYHISYAAHREKNPPGQQEYCRARYYPVTLSEEFHGTDLEPDYWNTGVFLPGKTYQITAIKTEQHLFYHVVGDGQDKLFAWDHTTYPLVNEGRIGIRHMACRTSRYAKVKIATC